MENQSHNCNVYKIEEARPPITGMLLREHPLGAFSNLPPPPAHTSFRCKDLAATMGTGGFGRRPRGQRESNPTWNAAWGGPRPRPFPSPPPPHLDPSAGRRKDSVDVRLQAAPASAGCCNKRRSVGVLTTERCPLTALEAGCPGSSSRPAASPGLSPGLAHTASSPCRRRLFSLCVPTPSFYELSGHTQLRPTPMTSF